MTETKEEKPSGPDSSPSQNKEQKPWMSPDSPSSQSKEQKPTSPNSSRSLDGSVDSALSDSAESLMRSLRQRESSLGRYDVSTSRSYSELGDLYLQMQDEQRAIVMHRTAFRIQSFLYGNCALGDRLSKQRGLPVEEIKKVREGVFESMKFEMEGDFHRREGHRKAAIREYEISNPCENLPQKRFFMPRDKKKKLEHYCTNMYYYCVKYLKLS